MNWYSPDTAARTAVLITSRMVMAPTGSLSNLRATSRTPTSRIDCRMMPVAASGRDSSFSPEFRSALEYRISVPSGVHVCVVIHSFRSDVFVRFTSPLPLASMR